MLPPHGCFDNNIVYDNSIHHVLLILMDLKKKIASLASIFCILATFDLIIKSRWICLANLPKGVFLSFGF